MNKIFLFFIIFYTNSIYASESSSESCQSSKVNLDIFSKNDFSLNSQSCMNDDRSYVVNTLKSNGKEFFVNKKEDEFGYNPPILEAVSIFKKNDLPPLLITLHSEYVCCYPRPEGKSYYVDLYQVIRSNNKFELKPYTSILGDNHYGFDGKNDIRQKVKFKYKNISLIKKWLDKNYK